MKTIDDMTTGFAVGTALEAAVAEGKNVNFGRRCRVLSDNDYPGWAGKPSAAPEALREVLPRGLRACEVLEVPPGILSTPSDAFKWYAIRASSDATYNVRSTTWVLTFQEIALSYRTIATAANGSAAIEILASIRAMLRDTSNRGLIAGIVRADSPEHALALAAREGGVLATWNHPESPDLEILKVRLDVRRGMVYPDGLPERARFFDPESLFASAHRESFARLNSLAGFAYVAAFDPQMSPPKAVGGAS